ncbi:MAG: FecR family protein [bacterium]
MYCCTAQREIEASLAAGAATVSEKVQAHLDSCEPCRREYQTLKRALNTLRCDTPWNPPEGFFDKLTRQALSEKQRAVTRADADSLAARLRWSLAGLWAPRRLSWGWAGAVAIACLVVAGSWWGIQDITTRTGKMEYVTGIVHAARGASSWTQATDGQHIRKGSLLRTATDGEAVMTLSDKSEVFVASFSEISIQESRHVEIRSGMAWFEVTPDDTQFTVEIPSYGRVRVLGTSFGIQVDPKSGECSIAVGTGRVVVEGEKKHQVLSGGEEVAILLGKNPVKCTPRQLGNMLNFRDQLVRKRNEYDLKKYYPSLAARRHSAKAR